jgi:peroxiredoxin
VLLASLKIAGALVALYLLLCAAFFFSMRQSPDFFARVMKRVPDSAFAVFPLQHLWLTARHGSLRVGDLAPDFTLESVDHTGSFQLSSLRGVKPVVLVFGSYTCPPFRHRFSAFNDLYAKYKDQAAFYMVYIIEAHTSDRWQDAANFTDNVVFASPRNPAERAGMGRLCLAKLDIKFPAVMDTFDNSAERAYTSWPNRLYVIDKDGRIAYKSLEGPFGFHPQGVAATLQKLFPAAQAAK